MVERGRLHGRIFAAAATVEAANSNGRRGRNEMSLVATLEQGTIVEAVKAQGYRSNSANFRAIVNQTLIKEKQFSSAGRGGVPAEEVSDRRFTCGG
jgi:hypothetical protein